MCVRDAHARDRSSGINFDESDEYDQHVPQNFPILKNYTGKFCSCSLRERSTLFINWFKKIPTGCPQSPTAGCPLLNKERHHMGVASEDPLGHFFSIIAGNVFKERSFTRKHSRWLICPVGNEKVKMSFLKSCCWLLDRKHSSKTQRFSYFQSECKRVFDEKNFPALIPDIL